MALGNDEPGPEEAAAFNRLVQDLGSVIVRFLNEPDGICDEEKHVMAMLAASTVVGGLISRFTADTRAEARTAAIGYLDGMVSEALGYGFRPLKPH